MIYNLKYNNLLSSTDGSIEKDKASEIIIVPCASAINKLVELKEKRDNYLKVRDCGNCEKVCCDSYSC